MAVVKPLKLRAEKISVREVLAAEDNLVEVIVDTGIFHLEEPYSYLVPESLAGLADIGSLVKVPFGRKMTEGVVVAISTASSPAKLKYIEGVISKVPLITAEQLAFFHDVQARYGCGLWDVIRLAIPAFSAKGEKSYLAQKSENGASKAESSLQRTATTYHSFQQLSQLLEESRSAEVKTLLLVPDEKSLSKFAHLADIVLSGEDSKSERFAKYLAANSLRCGIVLGLRSAIFLHLETADRIVVIDELDSSFYEQHSPTYNVRDLVLIRSKTLSIDFLSTLPSLEISRLIETGYLQSRKLKVPSRKFVVDEPSKIHGLISTALKDGSVLLVHAQAGYVKSFTCNNCRNIALCDCGSQLGLNRDGAGTFCLLCGKKEAQWRCVYCHETTPRTLAVGVEKIAENYGRSFPGVRVLSSTQHSPILQLPSENALVLSTPSMEPIGEYSAVFLLDGDLMFNRIGLRSEEQSFLHWMNALRNLKDGGTLYISLPTAHPITQGIIRGNIEQYSRARIAERTTAHFPPNFRILILSGEKRAIADFKNFMEVNRHEGSGLADSDSFDLELPDGKSRLVFKYSVEAGNRFANWAHAFNRVRSLQGSTLLRVAVDPFDFI